MLLIIVKLFPLCLNTLNNVGNFQGITTNPIYFVSSDKYQIPILLYGKRIQQTAM